MIYGNSIEFPDFKNDLQRVVSLYRIANLTILIWLEKNEDGSYTVDNFFNYRDLNGYTDDDPEKANPFPFSQFLLLRKEAFVHASNLDIQAISDGVRNMEYNEVIAEPTIQLMLNHRTFRGLEPFVATKWQQNFIIHK